jgi:SAM-dependent methyltransferase
VSPSDPPQCRLDRARSGLAATIHVASLEDALRSFSDQQFDFVFSLAVLEHVHDDSEAVFAEIARITSRVLVTIEDERNYTERHFPRTIGGCLSFLALRRSRSKGACPT